MRGTRVPYRPRQAAPRRDIRLFVCLVRHQLVSSSFQRSSNLVRIMWFADGLRLCTIVTKQKGHLDRAPADNALASRYIGFKLGRVTTILAAHPYRAIS